MRTVITGSEGFIASHLSVAGELLEVDIVTNDDIRMQSTIDLIREFDPEIIYHLAAHHFIPWCEANPIETERTNVMGTANVMEACGPSLKSFVLASSAAVYGYDPKPIDERHPLAGRSVYAHSKYQAELLLRQFADRRDEVACVAARLFNVVGPGDNWGHVLPVILQHRHERVYLGNTWPQRDYVHVTDVAAALKFLAHQAPAGFTEWNVGTGIGTSVATLVERVSEITGLEVKTMTYAGKVRSDDGHLVSDPSKLGAFGWMPKLTLDDAIRDILDGLPG